MRMKCTFLFSLVLASATSIQAALVVNYSGAWRFLKGPAEASSPVSAWRSNTFNDGAWSVAGAPFYYGEPLTGGTVLGDMNGTYTSIFMRKTFNVANPAQITGMELRTLCDDGFIARNNGVEGARFNMAAGEIPATGTATNTVEAVPRLHVLPNPSPYLVAGQNVIAIQAFNSSLSGLDFVMDAQLVAAI